MENLPVSNRFAARCLQLAAVMLIIAAVYRALSINNLVIGVSTGDISKHYGASVLIDGSFASMLMLLTAIWLLFLARGFKAARAGSRMQAMLIGFSFTVFGGGFWWRYPSSLRMPAFLLVGLLILVPGMFFWKKTNPKSIQPDPATDR